MDNKQMTKKEMIRYLKSAAKDFMKKPSNTLMNNRGLCFYFKFKHKLDDNKVKKLIGCRLLLGYLFASSYPYKSSEYSFGHSQDNIWKRRNIRKYRYDRAIFCLQRIKEIENNNIDNFIPTKLFDL